jgi:hypothetical protein
MALKQVEPTKEKVGGFDFYITPFAAFKAANLTGELASVLAPLLGVLAPLVNDRNLMDVDAGKAAEAMMNCKTIDGDSLEKLMKKLLLGGHIAVEIINEDTGEKEGARLDEDIANEIFCGEIQDMFVLCFHVIKLNFNGFFKKFAALSGKVGLAEVKTPRAIL